MEAISGAKGWLMRSTIVIHDLHVGPAWVGPKLSIYLQERAALLIARGA